jgi:hypothetical protein
VDLREADRIHKGKAFRHPWELSRTASIISFIKHNPSAKCYADIGAGDRYFAQVLARHTSRPVFAVDIGYTCIEQSKDLICLPSFDMIPDGQIDCLFLLDVLEHIADEHTFLEGVLKKLKPSANLIITVPAFQFIFSSHDRFLDHKRRYTRKQISTVLTKAGIIIERSFYFYTSLLFVRLTMLLLEKVAITKRTMRGVESWRFSERHPLSVIFTALLNMDFAIGHFMGRVGICPPGLSLCCLCNKKSA